MYRLQRFYHMSIGCSMAFIDFVLAEQTHESSLTGTLTGKKLGTPHFLYQYIISLDFHTWVSGISGCYTPRNLYQQT